MGLEQNGHPLAEHIFQCIVLMKTFELYSNVTATYPRGTIGSKSLLAPRKGPSINWDP